MSPKISALESSKKEMTKRLDGVKASSSKALKQTTDFVDQMVQVGVIMYLEERRRDQARLFMTLSQEVNSQTSWLVNMSHTNNVLAFKGMAIDNPTVSALLSRMQSHEYFRNVELQQVVGANVNGLPLVTFDIKAETVFPGSSLAEKGLPEIRLPDTEQVKKLVSNISPDLVQPLENNEKQRKTL
jgi:Tfp pilus assembly protein PilN